MSCTLLQWILTKCTSFNIAVYDVQHRGLDFPSTALDLLLFHFTHLAQDVLGNDVGLSTFWPADANTDPDEICSLHGSLQALDAVVSPRI
jgi:hypothetical protein